MPPVPNVPSVPRRQVAHILTKLHRESGLYIKNVAEQVNLHHTTVSKMLKGEPCKLKPIYIDKLCEIYRASADVREDLKVLAAEAESAHGWWHTFTDPESTSLLSTYITLESKAAAIMMYQNVRVPGLLQTPGYARALLRAHADITSEEIDRHIEIRLSRRAALSDSGANVDILLDENVVHRPLNDPQIGGPQLRHIAAVSNLPNFRIRLVPFGVGLYSGMEAGAFTLLESAGVGGSEPEHPVVYVESGVGSALYFDKAEQVARYRQSWADIERAALSASTTRSRLTEILKEVLR